MLEWSSSLDETKKSTIVRMALPGDETDEQSRYMEYKVDDLTVVCIYAPNGNPTPGVDHRVRDWEKSSEHVPTWIELEDDLLVNDYL